MTSIPKLTGWDKLDLSNAAGDGVRFMIEHWYDIMRIATAFCNGDPGVAFRDIMDKGLSELLMMCGMDEEASKDAAKN